MSEPGHDHDGATQRVLLDKLRGRVEDGQHLRVLQVCLLPVEDLPQSVHHGQVGFVLQAQRPPSARLQPEVLHQLAHLLADDALQPRLAQTELLQSFHGEPPLFPPVLPGAEHDPSGGGFLLVRLEESVEDILELSRSPTESVIFECLVDQVKVIQEDAALLSEVKTDNWTVEFPPSVEGKLQVETDVEKTSNDWERPGTRGEIFIFVFIFHFVEAENNGNIYQQHHQEEKYEHLL